MGARTIEHFQGLWSQDPAMHRLFRIVERVARTDVRVLVRGETGAGKELVAQAVHALSARARRPFRAINCAALPASLLESELFGHVKGAFTGAVRDAPGHLKLASGGTLFLDEVGEMPLELQAKLLRAIETREVLRLGAVRPVAIDVRFLAATHRDLIKMVEAGTFRADLYYRVNGISIHKVIRTPTTIIVRSHRLMNGSAKSAGPYFHAAMKISTSSPTHAVFPNWINQKLGTK